MSQSVPSSPTFPSEDNLSSIGLENVASTILRSPCRTVFITFIVTLPVPTMYDVAITGDFNGLGDWNISKPLFLRRKSPLEYTAVLRLYICEDSIASIKGNSGLTQGNMYMEIVERPTFKDAIPTIYVDQEVLHQLYNTGFILKYKYLTLLDGAPMSWETANRKICLKWWVGEECECIDVEEATMMNARNMSGTNGTISLPNGAPASNGISSSHGSAATSPVLNVKASTTPTSNGTPSPIVNGITTSPTSLGLPPANQTCFITSGKTGKLPSIGNKAKFVIDKHDPTIRRLIQNDGLFGSSSLRKFGRNVPSLYKPVDSEWIFDHIQLRIYQPTDSYPRLNEEDVIIHTLGKKTRLNIVDTDTYVLTAPTLESLSFRVNILDPENPDNVTAVAFITHELLQKKDVGEICAPFIDTKSLKIIGHFKALFLLVKPYKHSDNNLRRVRRTLNWQQQSHMKTPEKRNSTKFIGHRGLGKSVSSKNRALIAENSMLSFQRSAAVGVDYIEFDVQLTKDLQPVIFHDFVAKIRVDEKNTISIPVQDLTLKQLSKLGMRLKPSFDDANVRRLTKLMEQRKHKLKRSNSYDYISYDRVQEHAKEKQMAWSISEAFATLKECFEKLPYHVGFNIEVKWPIETNIFNPNIPRNVFIDHILECVFDYSGPRHIMFSSFDPDICTLLNLKQPKYPVFFLTEAGTATFADHRCNSIPAAISFAKAVGLRGIVADCTPIIKNPEWIQMVHEHDLMISTFGEANSLPENIKVQQDMGIDAIICDNIDRILKNRKKLEKEGIDIDPQQLLNGEPTRLSQWIETQDSSITYPN